MGGQIHYLNDCGLSEGESVSNQRGHRLERKGIREKGAKKSSDRLPDRKGKIGFEGKGGEEGNYNQYIRVRTSTEWKKPGKRRNRMRSKNLGAGFVDT